MGKFHRLLIIVLIFILCTSTALAIDRRKPQFATESAYLILPMPYSLPGIGEGLMFTGLAANIADSYADVFGVVLTGDVQGAVVGVLDLHLISETIFFDFFGNNINKAQVKNYENRGMKTDKEDFKYHEASLVSENSVEIYLSFFDRRFEITGEIWSNRYELTKIKDVDGNVEVEFDDPVVEEDKGNAIGMVLDYTDDRQDPWMGVRLEVQQKNSPRDDNKNADYNVINLSADFYIPIGDNSTWGFHFLTSDAVVQEKGQIDTDAIIQELGLSCASYASCSEAEKNLIDKKVTERTYGTADSLGGQRRLRSYPMGRYSGAHMTYMSTEFRWNFATDVVPFDFWIWKDVATGFQLALFYEVGSVAEEKEDLGEETKSSYGTGLRMVSASGFVYRADLGFGDEGQETTIMFQYPW